MNMKTKLMISLMTVLTVSTIAQAAVSRSEISTGEFLINNGFSQETARLVEVKNKKYHDLTPASDSKFINTMWKIDKYFDPMYDDPTFGITQNIKFDNNELKEFPGYERRRAKKKMKQQQKQLEEQMKNESTTESL